MARWRASWQLPVPSSRSEPRIAVNGVRFAEDGQRLRCCRAGRSWATMLSSGSVAKPMRFFLGSGGCMSCLIVAKTTWKLRSCTASLRSSWLRPCEKQRSEFDGELSLVRGNTAQTDEGTNHENADFHRPGRVQHRRRHDRGRAPGHPHRRLQRQRAHRAVTGKEREQGRPEGRPCSILLPCLLSTVSCLLSVVYF